MGMSNQASYANAAFTGSAAFTNANALTSGMTAKQVIGAPTANGLRMDSIHCCNSDSVNHALNFYITVGGTDVFIGQISVAAGSGISTSVGYVEALASLNANLSMVVAGSGQTTPVTAVKCSLVTTAVTSGNDAYGQPYAVSVVLNGATF
jgi:hypothetical protein